MEFTALVELFDTLSPLKLKYRILGRYIKSLKSKTGEVEQNKEVESFRQFLLANPNISEKKFSDPKFKSKDNIYMDCFSQLLSGDELDRFWSKMIETEQIFFPSGRPEIKTIGEGMTLNEAVASANTLMESDEAQKLVGDDPLLAEVMKQVVSSGALSNGGGDGPVDVAAIMQNPKFMELASNITGSLTSGKYTKDSLEKTVDTLTGLVGDDVDPELKKMMTFLKKSVKDIKAGRPADLSTLVEMISSFNIGGATGLDLGPMMQMMMQGGNRRR